MVLHHTSNRHPWFQAAESDPRSRFREYYIWSETEPPDSESQSAFPGEPHTDGIWSWSERARAFYRHQFYDFEPDLRIASDAVWEEVKGILDFWIALGADAFRIDAAGLLFADIGLPGDQADAGKRLDDLHRYLKKRAPDVALLGEVDLPPEQLPTYFDKGRIDQLLAFLPNNALLHSLAIEDAGPLCAAVARHDEAVQHGAWRQFLRNLDELNLSHLSDEDRDRVFGVFAPNEEERIYGRGIRRGWAPMMEHDASKRMTLSLLFALPGAPLLVAGQEIGTGDDLSLEGRAAVRLPMQWSAEQGGGFSTSSEGEAAHLVTDGPYGIAQRQRRRSGAGSGQPAAPRPRAHPPLAGASGDRVAAGRAAGGGSGARRVPLRRRRRGAQPRRRAAAAARRAAGRRAAARRRDRRRRAAAGLRAPLDAHRLTGGAPAGSAGLRRVRRHALGRRVDLGPVVAGPPWSRRSRSDLGHVCHFWPSSERFEGGKWQLTRARGRERVQERVRSEARARRAVERSARANASAAMAADAVSSCIQRGIARDGMPSAVSARPRRRRTGPRASRRAGRPRTVRRSAARPRPRSWRRRSPSGRRPPYRAPRSRR